MKTRFNSFDFLKGIACIAVILIHFNFPANIGLAVKSFCRFAVPVFFIISGFFFANNGEINDSRTVKKTRHTFVLILGATVFYCIFVPLFCTSTINSWNINTYVTNLFTIDKIAKFFITNDPFAYPHLWFLLALLYCYIFSLIFFSKKSRLPLAKYIAPVLLLLYTCMQEFGGILKITTSFSPVGSQTNIWLYNAFIFRALPFFLFGIVLSQHQEKIKNISLNNISLIVIAFIGGVLAISERFIFSESQFFVGNYIMVAAMFIVALRVPDKGNKLIVHIGRDLSLYVYVLHIAIAQVLDFIFKSVLSTIFYQYSKGLLVIICSVIISEIIFQARKYLRFKQAE